MKLTGTYRKLVRDTTINDTTLLSTDYLNHFNELIMLLEMVSDMPDMLEEALAWQPKSYQDHFRDSVFQHKDLAIWAYENAPDEYRHPMDDCVAELDRTILTGVPPLQSLVEKGDVTELNYRVGRLTNSLRDEIDTLSALINGAMDQEGYSDRLAWKDNEVAEEDHKVLDQASIDALFD